MEGEVQDPGEGRDDQEVDQSGGRLADLQGGLVVDVVLHAPRQDDRLRAPPQDARQGSQDADEGRAARGVVGGGGVADVDNGRQGDNERDDLVQVHPLLEEDEGQEGAHRRVEGGDNGRVARADVVDRDQVAAHADGPAQQRAQDHGQAGAGARRPPGVAQAAAHAHVDQQDEGAGHVVQDRAGQGGLVGAQEGHQGRGDGEHDGVQAPQGTAEDPVPHESLLTLVRPVRAAGACSRGVSDS